MSRRNAGAGPGLRRRAGGGPAAPPAPRRPPMPTGVAALDDTEIAALASGLESLPAPFAPLDVSALDGFLCGLLVQPQPPVRSDWLPWVFDESGRAPLVGAEVERLTVLVERRRLELQAAIARRDWFDPWVFAVEDETAESDPIGAAVGPWVVGLAGALAAFPALLSRPSAALDEALAAALRFLDPDELEDAAGLDAAIELLEPATTLEEAVEGLTRSVLLLADVADSLRSPGR